MPGILGIIGKASPEERKDTLTAMLKTMLHEPFYTSGYLQEDSLEIGVGWTAHKSSFSDCLPLWNEDHDICLIFSGEDFGAAERAGELKSKGHVFNPRDASGLVHLYEELGPRFVEQINGLFSGLLLDLRQRKVLLFNDRYGMERIYWHETPEAFYFASEAKALLRVLPELREFDPQGVAQFLGTGCTFGERTLFRGISRLPGGALWTFEGGQCERKIYFSPEQWEQQAALTAEEYEGRFQETFKQILPRYFAAESKIGIALTGGLDTRMIMACRPETNPPPVCYTFTAANGKTLDDRIAARVAAACGLEHHLLRLEPDFFSEFAAHADRTVYLTDGAFGILGVHEVYCHRQARPLSMFRVVGNCGSEVFRGVSLLKPHSHARQLFHPDFAAAVNAAGAKIDTHKAHPVTFALFKEIPWERNNTVVAGRSQLVIRIPYLDIELAKLAYQMPPVLRQSSLPASRLICANSPALGKIPTDRGFSDHNSGPAFWWRRVFAEVTFKMDYCQGEGLPKRLAVFNPPFRFATSVLKIAGLHKFLCYGHWFRNELADYVGQRLAEAPAHQNQFFDPAFVRQLAAEHSAGKRNYATEIDAVLTLESVERQLFRELPRGVEPS